MSEYYYKTKGVRTKVIYRTKKSYFYAFYSRKNGLIKFGITNDPPRKRFSAAKKKYSVDEIYCVWDCVEPESLERFIIENTERAGIGNEMVNMRPVEFKLLVDESSFDKDLVYHQRILDYA